jgi:hypothetical protein
MRVMGCSLFTFIALGCRIVIADVVTPNNVTAPFAVQPSAGLLVTSGVTGPLCSAKNRFGRI